MKTFSARALPVASRGAAVFPCGPDKAPLITGGFKGATTSVDQIKAWSKT